MWWLPEEGKTEKLLISVISGTVIMVIKPILVRIKNWIIDQIREFKTRGTSEIKKLIGDNQVLMTAQFEKMESNLSAMNEQVNLLMSMKVSDDFANEAAGIFQTDRTGKFTSVNPKFCRISGRTTDELLGSGWINMVNEPERSDIIKKWRYAVNEERNMEMQMTIRHPEDGLLWINVKAFKMTAPSGALIGFRGRVTEVLK